MRPNILLMQPMLDLTEAALDAVFEMHRLFQAKDREAFLADIAEHVRGIATGGGLGASRAIIEALPALEIIAVNGIGTDAVDLDLARRRSIRVTTTPDVLTDDVADLAVALLLAASRRLCVGDRFVRDGRWPSGNLPLARKVSGKRAGILGLGRIGRAVARRLAGFDMRISYTDMRALQDVPYTFVPNLEELARSADFLIVAAAGGPGSRGLVGGAVLDALGPEGILINVARGSVVDEPALVAALSEGRLGGAGLDVFANEPNVPRPLWSLDNVVLQPHSASATLETRKAMGDLLVTNLRAHFAGEPLPSAVL